MTRAISALLTKAAREFRLDGIVSTDLSLQLGAEGYDLNKLDGDVEQILEKSQ